MICFRMNDNLSFTRVEMLCVWIRSASEKKTIQWFDLHFNDGIHSNGYLVRKVMCTNSPVQYASNEWIAIVEWAVSKTFVDNQSISILASGRLKVALCLIYDFLFYSSKVRKVYFLYVYLSMLINKSWRKN